VGCVKRIITAKNTAKFTGRKGSDMPRLVALTFGLLLIPAVGLAQKPAAKAPAEPVAQQAPVLPPMVAPYTPQGAESIRASNNSRELVQQNAAMKASQRRQRMAALSAMGYSPLRPPASPIPIMGSYGNFVGVGNYFPFPTFLHPGGPLVVGQAGGTVNR
jgi:hypothetical protein